MKHDDRNNGVKHDDQHFEDRALPDPTYYVAIGASAGGLEALQDFFRHTPIDSNLAFIVIQHLSPDFKSVMDELLGRCTEMPVFHAKDGAKVKRNTIYLIPSRKNMMIAEGKLLLADQMEDKGTHFPIDIFFRALAEDQHHHSVGIVLSGTGSDGSRGLQAIKEVGGFVMVQSPKDAKFNGMPYSAIKTGLSDVTDTAKVLPEKLIKFITHPIISNKDDSLVQQVKDNDSVFLEIFKLLKERSDIDFTQYKPSTVARRIERRIGVHGLSSIKEYYTILIAQPSEIQTLAKDMLIGVTRFFRDDDAFHELEHQVINNILDQAKINEPIRIWIAGCSTGEEAYSIAMLFDERMKQRGESFQIKVFATDVDPDAISEASSGIYRLSARDDMPAERLKRYFIQKDDHILIAPTIRQMVVFATHNLISDPPFSNTHLSVCRNVLIYFQAETQKCVLSMLHFSLRQNGYLFLGSSETLGQMSNYFDVIHERGRLFKKSSTARLTTAPINGITRQIGKKTVTPTIEQLLLKHQDKQKFGTAPIIEGLINEYVPPCIILNQDLEVVYAFGDASRYTRKYRSGEFSSNIKNIIIEELITPISTAIHRAITNQEQVLYENIAIKEADDKQTAAINLRVRYERNKHLNTYQLALIFEEKSTRQSPANTEKIHYDAASQNQQRVVDLESQLQKNEEFLQVTVEELETTNEELQSSNEELLAANEELQSTNEELQSVNEELHTVNSEYQEKIDQITQINSDLDNIMNSIEVGILFLDEAMLIRNFNPAIRETINLLPTDIGRPFHHISHQLNNDSLIQDIANVTEHGQSHEKEVSTHQKEKVLIKIAPYTTGESEKQGCVLSITNITETKKMSLKLEESYGHLRQTIFAALKPAKATIKLLIIDDNEADLILTKRLIEDISTHETHYITRCCNSFEEGLQAIYSETFDICFIDYLLDGKTAFELLEQISQEKNAPPCMMLSGHITEELHSLAINVGIYDALDKNQLTPILLERSIRYILRFHTINHYLQKVEKRPSPPMPKPSKRLPEVINSHL